MRKIETDDSPAPIWTLYVDPMRWREEYKPFAKTLILFITSDCNIQCEHCFNQAQRGRFRTMSLEYIDTIINANPGIDKYDLMGGEPLLHPQINEIVQLLARRGKKVGLYTNGLLLDLLDKNKECLKICISFQSITSRDPSRRPIAALAPQLRTIIGLLPVKLVFLVNEDNKNQLLEAVSYVEKTFPGIKRMTIGSIRDERDYWNDTSNKVLPLMEYANIVQSFINTYAGRLDIDIFTKGILSTPLLPQSAPHQLNRFKCIYPDGSFASCLYLVAGKNLSTFDPTQPIPYQHHEQCQMSGRAMCLADKIRLVNVNNKKNLPNRP